MRCEKGGHREDVLGPSSWLRRGLPGEGPGRITCREFMRALFFRQRDITSTNLDTLMRPVAEGLKIPAAAWDACVRSGAARDGVVDDLSRATSIGVTGTPTVFVNGVLVDVDVREALEPAIQEALAGK